MSCPNGNRLIFTVLFHSVNIQYYPRQYHQRSKAVDQIRVCLATNIQDKYHQHAQTDKQYS